MCEWENISISARTLHPHILLFPVSCRMPIKNLLEELDSYPIPYCYAVFIKLV